MAIAFARMSVHTRTKGHSAIAGAAYRAGMELYDERTGETHNYANRADVVYSQIMLPEGSDDKYLDRAYLWNQAEECEKRKDAQVAKDIILALPKGVDLDTQIALARNFAHYHFVSKGIPADIAIHHHSDGNPHAHIYMATRKLGAHGFDKYKARDLNPDFAKGKVISQDYWGEQWRDFQNQYFHEHGIDMVVDANHILTQRHEGRITDEAHYIKEENQLYREASIEIALNDPVSILNILGTKYGVFSDREIGSILSKNTETLEQYHTALLRLKAHKELILLGPGDDGRDRYTTRANYIREADMADHAKSLMLNKNHGISAAILNQTLEQSSLNGEQKIALDHIGNSGDICAVVGRAGTGKSYMMRAAKNMWELQGYNVRGMAVSGIAAKGLEAETGIKSTTIHSLKMQIAYGSCNINAGDILVMDEAGMTNLHDMAIIVEIAKKTGAKLVLVGDHAQLQPIGAGAPFRAIVEKIGFVELNKIQRQEKEGDRNASVMLSKGNVSRAIDYYNSQGRVHLINPNEANLAVSTLINDWQTGLTSDNIRNRLILAHRNIDVKLLNKTARQTMLEQRLVEQNSHKALSAAGEIELAKGDRILFLRNNKSMGISNGEFATVTNIAGKQITAQLKQKEITFSTDDYQDFNYGYAATVHKSQGATFDDTYIYAAGKGWNRFLAYTALTRHKKNTNIYLNKEEYGDLEKLKSTLSRGSFNDSVLDWPISYAIRRGFDPEGIIGRFIDKVSAIKESIKDKWLYITNYEAYLQHQQNHEKQIANQTKREDAKKIADFVDLQRDLSRKWRRMRQESPIIFDHPKYKETYEQTKFKNKLAHEIYQDIDKYKPALELNRITPDYLKEAAETHEKAASKQIAIEKDKSPIPAREKQRSFISQQKPTQAKKPKQQPKIDWHSPVITKELQALRQMNHTQIKLLASLHSKYLGKEIEFLSKDSIRKELDSLATTLLDINIDKSRIILQSKAPNLTAQVKAFAKFKAQERNISREYRPGF